MDNDKIHCIFCDKFIFKRKRTQHIKTKGHLDNVAKFFNYDDIPEIASLFVEEPDYKLPIEYNNVYRLEETSRLDTSTSITIYPKTHLGILLNDINVIIGEVLNSFVRINKKYRFKYIIAVNGHYVKPDYEEMGDDTHFIREIKSDIYTNQTQIQLVENNYNNIVEDIRVKLREVEIQGSGYNLQDITSLNIQMYHINQPRGRSYIKLPFTHQSLLNIKNDDNLCFLWSILAHLHPIDSKNNSSRVNKYKPFINELNINDIDLTDGMKIKDINKFEKLNNNQSINVFELEKDKTLVPLYISENYLDKTIIDLLLYKNHYILIKKLHLYINNSHDYKIVCRKCLSSFNNNERLKEHQILCNDKKAIKYKPYHEKYLSWNKYHEKMPIYITVIADFECRNQPINNNDNNTEKTQRLYKQIPVCNSYQIINRFENKTDIISEGIYHAPFGNKNNDWFVHEMNKLNHKATKFFEKEHDREIISEKICDKCWLCEKEFDNQAQIMHFCKLSGKYLGNAHNQCIHIAEKNNRNHIVPIFFHNLEGYDSHIFINKLINSKKDEKIHIIPHTNEKFMSFNYGKLKFLDSLKFLQHSLDECAQSLKDKDFIFLKKEFGDNYHLFTKKIAYSYDYFETLEDYEKDINLLKDDDYVMIKKLSNINHIMKNILVGINITKRCQYI